VIASIQFRAAAVRSGMLLMALLEDEELGRLARDASRELAKVKVEVLGAEFAKLAAGSPEGGAPSAAPHERRPSSTNRLLARPGRPRWINTPAT
jgi:type VI secretion system protein VasG